MEGRKDNNLEAHVYKYTCKHNEKQKKTVL